MKIIIGIIVAMTIAVASAETSQVQKIDPRLIGMLTDFYNDIIAAPINTLASSLAGMLAQVTAGIAVGKRGIMDALSDLGQALGNHFYNQINQSVQNIALQITQSLANFAVGKRGIMDALSDLGQALGNHFYNQINQSVQNIALQITQSLANFAVGKREALNQEEIQKIISKGILDSLSQLGQALGNGLYNQLNQSVQNIALQITQSLADFAIGKREALNQEEIEIILTKGLSSWIQSTVQSLALTATSILANIAENGILPTIG